MDVKTYNLTSCQGPFINLGNVLPVGRFFGNCPLGAFLQLLLKQLVLATDRDKKPAQKQLICPQTMTSVGVLPVPLVPDCSQGKPGAMSWVSQVAALRLLGQKLRWDRSCGGDVLPKQSRVRVSCWGWRLEDINSWETPLNNSPPGGCDNPHSPWVPPASRTRYRSQETNCSPCQFSI